MKETREQKVDRRVFETVRSIYVTGKTGLLTIQKGAETLTYFFVGGEMYLGRDDSLSLWVEPLLASELDPTTPDTVLQRIRDDDTPFLSVLESLAGLGVDSGVFEESVSDIPADAIGPLPTAELIMEAAVRKRDEFQLLRRLGGENRKLVAVSDLLAKRRLPALDTHEAFILSRAEQATSVRDLLSQSGLDKLSTLVTICRLDAVGLLVAGELGTGTAVGRLVSPSVLDRFSDRIAKSLAEFPLELDTRQHALEVVGLIGRVGTLNHYDLLSVAPGDPPERVYQAFTELARAVHPSHSASLSVDGRGIGLELIFERSVEAYLTLSDPVRSRSYRDLVQSELSSSEVNEQSSEERVEERRSLARQNFEAARSMVRRNDFHSAIQLLQQCVRTDPQAEYFVLLARCQMKNPQWQEEALASCRRALDLDPSSSEVRLQLAHLQFQQGHVELARQNIVAVIERNPVDEKAVALLADLDKKAGPGADGGQSGSLLDRLRGMFKR